MTKLTEEAASDLFRSNPDHFLDMGPGKGEVAVRTVGSGPDVLFVHGWPVHSATFRRLLPHLVEHVTCHLIDLPGAGSSKYDSDTNLTLANHVASVRRSVELLELDSVAVVGHDSGGMIARHAMAGSDRLRAMGLIDTEPSGGVGIRFKSFIGGRRLPGFGAGLGWLAGKPKLRRTKFVLGDAFSDRSHLDGEFAEFFLRPLNEDKRYRDAQMSLLKSFDMEDVTRLADVQTQITCPVQLVWGVEDKFFPIAAARRMVDDFAEAELTEIPGAGLFSHEEAPAAVAAALLPTLTA